MTYHTVTDIDDQDWQNAASAIDALHDKIGFPRGIFLETPLTQLDEFKNYLIYLTTCQ